MNDQLTIDTQRKEISRLEIALANTETLWRREREAKVDYKRRLYDFIAKHSE